MPMLALQENREDRTTLYGAEFDRHTEQYLEAAGLDLVEKEFLYKDIIKLLTVRPRVS